MKATRATSKTNLTAKEAEFVKHYTNPKAPTYRNGTKAMLATNPHMKKTSAQTHSSALIKSKHVNKALRDILDTPNYKSLINKRLSAILEDDTARPRDVLGAMDFHAKITGAYSPEKHMNMNLTPADRDKKYEDIMAKVRGEQTKIMAETPPEVPLIQPTTITSDPVTEPEVTIPNDEEADEEWEEEPDEDF